MTTKKKNIRILITCPKPPWVIGGIERVVSETTKRLAKENEVVIYTKGKTNSTIVWNGVVVKTFKEKIRYFSPNMMIELRKNLNDFDVVHTHSLSHPVSFETFFVINNEKLFVSPHYHIGASTPLFNIIKKIYDPLICKAILKKAKKIICVSETEKTNLIKKFNQDENKCVVIPNGVNIDLIQRAKPFDCKNKDKYFLYVGRLEKYKNIHLIIRSMLYTPLHYNLIIAGDGPYKKNLQQLILSLNLQERVQIFSGLPDDEIYRWYKTCHLVINFSSQEAFGITIIEGLAAGKPVIVNIKTALGEMAKKYKQVFSINPDELSDEDIAKHLISMASIEINTPDLSDYGWDLIARQTKKVYGFL